MSRGKPMNFKSFKPTRNIRILNEMEQLPDTMYIGNDCNKGHGVRGKTVRYKEGGHCIACMEEQAKLSRSRKESNKVSVPMLSKKLDDLRAAKVDQDDLDLGWV